jgi:hypothetical protein
VGAGGGAKHEGCPSRAGKTPSSQRVESHPARPIQNHPYFEPVTTLIPSPTCKVSRDTIHQSLSKKQQQEQIPSILTVCESHPVTNLDCPRVPNPRLSLFPPSPGSESFPAAPSTAAPSGQWKALLAAFERSARGRGSRSRHFAPGVLRRLGGQRRGGEASRRQHRRRLLRRCCSQTTSQRPWYCVYVPCIHLNLKPWHRVYAPFTPSTHVVRSYTLEYSRNRSISRGRLPCTDRCIMHTARVLSNRTLNPRCSSSSSKEIAAEPKAAGGIH